MLSRYVVITSLFLVACGTGDPARPSAGNAIEPYDRVDAAGTGRTNHVRFRDRFGCDAGAADSASDASVADSGPDSGGDVDAGDVEFDSGTVEECAPTIGHCLTNMATRCYETSFDDTEACAKTGMSSGWRLGSCDPYNFYGEVRTNGGCRIGCQLTWTYPLGGILPTDQTRADAKLMCEQSGGTYVYPPPAAQ